MPETRYVHEELDSVYASRTDKSQRAIIWRHLKGSYLHIAANLMFYISEEEACYPQRETSGF